MKKTILILLTTVFTFGIVITANSQNKNSEFEVLGNCGMCKTRIEKAAKSVDGVSTASWDKKTKMIKVNYDKKKTSAKDISLAIIAIGHDTKFGKAQNETYSSLPGCCKYDRDEAKTTVKIVKSYSFSVNGKCGMCKKRIEKAAKNIHEVVSAVWDKETKILTVGVSNKKGTKKIISKAIASIGHDTEFDKAETAVYDALPGCCHYNRTK
jgi:membrane fusion protein, copper/silver efflux system